jgi:hypothetical protein
VSERQHDAHVRNLRELQKEIERKRRARYRVEQNHADGRPDVRHEAWKKDRDEDPLLEALKEGKR